MRILHGIYSDELYLLLGDITVDAIESSKILPAVGTIPALSTGIIELIPYATFFSVRYFVALKDGAGKTSSFDYSITTDNSGSILDVIFGKIDGGLAHNVISDVSGGQVRFRIQNNEATTVTYKVQKLGF